MARFGSVVPVECQVSVDLPPSPRYLGRLWVSYRFSLSPLIDSLYFFYRSCYELWSVAVTPILLVV